MSVAAPPRPRAGPTGEGEGRPVLAIITGVPNPYRLHLHRRIAREIPGVVLYSLYTHGVPEQPWANAEAPETRPVWFGPGDPVTRAAEPRRALRELRKGRRVARWLREHRAGAVLLGGYNDAGRLWLLHACRRAGVPVFLVSDSNIHGDTATGLKRAAKDRLLRWVLRRVAGVLPCGGYGRAYFERYGVPPERIFLAPYEPDYGLIRGVPEPAIREAAARFGLAPGRRRLVFCGRMVRVKRPDLILEAFTRLRDRRPEWDLVMIGDGPMLAGLRASAAAAGLGGRVIFTGFIGAQAEISAIYRAAHVFVLPSDYEPWGVVINEAVAAGLAVVATRVVGAAGELVRDGVNGRTVEPGQVDGLTSALLEATDPANTERYRAGSGIVLDEWRRRADPVDGIRAALRSVGIVPADAGSAAGAS
ncbi:MAG TPA: glycosyltransferase [Phycisphaerales bacterium]|nr:glycosyltransferase [Phycisphaerales bacterium]